MLHLYALFLSEILLFPNVKNALSSWSSRLTPRQLESLSENTVFSLSLLAAILRNASILKAGIKSKWVALVDKHINKPIALWEAGFKSCTSNGFLVWWINIKFYTFGVPFYSSQCLWYNYSVFNWSLL